MDINRLIELSKQGKTKGGEKEREETAKIAVMMYEKIKFIDKEQRTAIIKIMEILSEMDNCI